MDCELRFIVAQKGREFQQCVFRISQTYRGNHDKFHKIRTTWKRWLELLACFGKPILPRCGKIPASSKQQLRQRRQQQSCVNTSEKKVHLHKEKDPHTRQNLDYNSWMPEMQRAFLRNSHLQVCMVRHHDEREREEARAMHWDVILPVLRRKFQNQLEENSRMRIGCIAFTVEDLKKG